MSPDAGTQNIVWRSVAPQNLSGSAGPGHVGHHRGRLLREQAEHRVLHRLDQQAGDRQHARTRAAAGSCPSARSCARAPRRRARSGSRCRSAAPAAPGRSGCRAARPRRAGAGSPAPSRGSPCPSGRRPGRAGSWPIAPATQASSTSLIEQSSALPIALTASSGIGSLQATRLLAARLALEPRRRVVGHQRQRGDVAQHLAADARHLAASRAGLLRVRQHLHRACRRRRRTCRSP